MKNTHLNCVQQLFFGFEKYLTIAPSNSLSKGEMVLAIDNNDYFKSMEVFALYLAKKREKSMNEFLDTLHIVWGGHTKRMHQDVRKEIFEHVMHNEARLGRKYTQKDLFESAFQVLNKYNKSID